MSNFDRFRKTFENLSSSFTSEDRTEQSKSEYTSDKSYYDSQSPYQVYPTSKSELCSYEQSDIDINKYISTLTQIQESLYAEVEHLNQEKKTLTNENIQLRGKMQDQEKQLDSLSEKLQKRDKELNKVLFEKDLLCKLDEESKRLIEDLKKNCESLLKENSDFKRSLELFKSEKSKLLKTLKETEQKSETLHKTFKSKEKFTLTLDHTSPDSLKTRNREHLKSSTGKFSLRLLNIPDKRGCSESPDREGLSDREETFRQVFLEAKKLLNASSSTDLKEKIIKLKEVQGKFKKTQKFISKLSNMLVQISPSGSFDKEPSTRQIWKWLTRLLEEYMKIKQSISGESFGKLAALLGTFHVEEMVEKVLALQRGRASLKGFNV